MPLIFSTPIVTDADMLQTLTDGGGWTYSMGGNNGANPRKFTVQPMSQYTPPGSPSPVNTATRTVPSRRRPG